MRLTARGFSTVECLVALTLFSLGALGAAGTIALGIRTAASGTHLSRATRIAGEVQDMMRYRLRTSQRSCSLVTPGRRIGPAGEVVDWSVAPASGGVRLVISLTYATPTGHGTDSIPGFLRCQ